MVACLGRPASGRSAALRRGRSATTRNQRAASAEQLSRVVDEKVKR